MIFDCDGVLVDSEPISFSVLTDTIGKAGIQLSAETVYERFLGKSMTSICETLSAEFGIDLSEKHLAGLRSTLFARFRNELRPVEGVADVLKRLKYERCVASSSQPDRIRLSLEITGLIDLAGPDIFSASMVARGKPAPDLFLYAADQMGVEPSKCIVIEDSPPGILAAREAGMQVFAFRGASHGAWPDLRSAIAGLKPDQTFDHMRELPDLLRALRPGRSKRTQIAGPLICAVDVGTTSARSGVFDLAGNLLTRSAAPIETQRSGPEQAEHDSENIWSAVCQSVRTAASDLDIPSSAIGAIGFDATCSLVFRGDLGKQLSVSVEGGNRWDTIAWHDHRAMTEADICNATKSPILEYVGASVSPEMQIPKMMWVKKHLPDTWAASSKIYDLADFLTYKATGSNERSQGTLTSKWMYQAHETEPWPNAFLRSMGLEDLQMRAGLPRLALAVGQPIGALAQSAAAQLGLSPNCVVAAGLIDAHAGILGLIGPGVFDRNSSAKNLALVAGTSNCVGILSREPVRFAGIWGPYFGSAIDGFWLSEAGQSASGALLDHMIRVHGAGGEPNHSLHRKIVGRIRELRVDLGGDLAPQLHVLPDFKGNRSPLGDPHLRGMIVGIGLDSTFDGLCKLYWRTCVGIALGIRDIVETMRMTVPNFESVIMAGGHTRNPLLLELYRDVIGMPLRTMPGVDAVLLGTAMNAAVAAGLHQTIDVACAKMEQPTRLQTAETKSHKWIERDFRIFREMIAQRQVLAQLQNA